MAISMCLVTTWNTALLAAGVCMAYFATFIANEAIDRLPDYFEEEMKSITDGLDDALIICGAVLAGVAIFGIIAFCCKSMKLMFTYMLILAVFIVAQIIFGVIFWSYRRSESFPPGIDGEANRIIEDSLEPYCDRVPFTGTPEEIQQQRDELFETYIKPLNDLGIDECKVPPAFVSKDDCLEDFQEPCEKGIILYTNDNLFWTGIILLSFAFLEMMVLIFGVNVYGKTKWQKRQKEKAARKAQMLTKSASAKSTGLRHRQRTKSISELIDYSDV